jgi:copper chaperone CopZ
LGVLFRRVGVKVQVLFFEGCPNHQGTVKLAGEVVAQLGLEAQVEEVEVRTSEDVQRLRFLGSPTVLVDGIDIEPAARERTDFGFCCRTYSGSGLPPRALLVEALITASGPVGESDCCKRPCAADPPEPVKNEGRPALWAAAGSVVSAVVASACCWLPLLLLAFGTSAAGASAAFERVRPLFLVVAAVLLSVGFYLTYFRTRACAPGSECPLPNPKLRRFNQVMLWMATVVVVAFAFFPNYVGLLLRNTDRAAIEDGRWQSETLIVQGMTCEACATEIQHELAKVPGVKQASVRYAEGKAVVTFDPSSPPSPSALIEAVKKAGYKGSLVAPSESGGRTDAYSAVTAIGKSSTAGQYKRVTLYVEGMTKVLGIT